MIIHIGNFASLSASWSDITAADLKSRLDRHCANHIWFITYLHGTRWPWNNIGTNEAMTGYDMSYNRHSIEILWISKKLLDTKSVPMSETSCFTTNTHQQATK